jgi:hypothetical protein
MQQPKCVLKRHCNATDDKKSIYTVLLKNGKKLQLVLGFDDSMWIP